MSYDCDECDWSGSPPVNPPEYVFAGDTQIARCPDCKTTLDTRENKLQDLGARFA